MRSLLLFLLTLPVAAGAVEYKCKDAQGNWTAAACTGAAAPPAKKEVAESSDGAIEVRKVKNHCAAKWPADFRMQQYCIEQQQQAVSRLAPVMDTMDWNSDLGHALEKCAVKWTDANEFRNWEMIEYCWTQQKKAYGAIR